MSLASLAAGLAAVGLHSDRGHTQVENERFVPGRAGRPDDGSSSVVSGPGAATTGGTTAPSATGAGQRPPLTEADRVRHVVRRLTFGPNAATIAEATAAGADAFIATQLDPFALDDSEIDARLSSFRTLDMTASQIWNMKQGLLDNRPVDPVIAIEELRFATLLRAVYSKRQLYELMVDFWSNHFNIFGNAQAEMFAMKPVDDREVIRPNAMGRFVDLLAASAHSPAMLKYLENDQNQGVAPNENYGRELLELHTVGTGVFTEADVLACALVFTGWGLDPETFRFTFRPERHATGPLQVLEWSTPGASGPSAYQDGESLLQHLAYHPATAAHLARKLCCRFVGDEPSADLIAGAANIYLENDTSIVPVLAFIFRSDEFWWSIGTKFRRPFEFTAATLRAVGADIASDPTTAEGESARLRIESFLMANGQWLFGSIQPNGYADRADVWATTGSLVTRWNFITELATGDERTIRIDPMSVVGVDAATSGEAVEGVLWRMTGGMPPAERRTAVLDALGLAADAPLPSEDWTLRSLISLALMSAEIHYR